MKLSRDLNDLTDKSNYAACVLLNEFKQCGINETGRTKEQQRENIAKGVSWTMDSYHLMNPKARAFDIYFKGDELYPKDINRWIPIINRMKECGMDCGYTLWGKDWMHFQEDETDYNQIKMENNLPTDWSKIMRDEVNILDYTVSHNAADPDAFEEKLRSMVELMIDRRVKKILEKLTK